MAGLPTACSKTALRPANTRKNHSRFSFKAFLPGLWPRLWPRLWARDWNGRGRATRVATPAPDPHPDYLYRCHMYWEISCSAGARATGLSEWGTALVSLAL